MRAGTDFLIKSIELPDRVTLQYVEHGESDGVPVLFLHGITDSLHSFSRILPRLPASVRAFALSQRGHGDSGRPPEGYLPGDFAADLAAFMDALGLARAVVAGHSMSSLIAQRFALDYPERTRGLVLIGSFIALRHNPGIPEFRDAVSKLEDPIDPTFALEFQQSTLAREVPELFLGTAVRESLKVPARVWKAALEGLVESDHSGEIGKIDAPTLIIWGDQDLFCTRADQESLHAAIEGAQLRVYQGTGHAPQWEEPERFAADIAAFIDGLSGKD